MEVGPGYGDEAEAHLLTLFLSGEELPSLTLSVQLPRAGSVPSSPGGTRPAAFEGDVFN